jgi:Mor family transcriptional regulator
MKKKLTDSQCNEICRRYQEGESTHQLGRAYGVCARTICKVLIRRDIERRPGGESKLLPDQRLEICRRYQEGESTIQLGRAYGVHEATIRQVLIKAGIERRSPNCPALVDLDALHDLVQELLNAGSKQIAWLELQRRLPPLVEAAE